MTNKRVCSSCSTVAKRNDVHCSHCGAALPAVIPMSRADVRKNIGYIFLGILIVAVLIGSIFSYILWDQRKNPVFDTITVNEQANINAIAALPQTEDQKASCETPSIKIKDDVVIDSEKSISTNHIKATDPKKPITVDGDVHIKGTLEVDKKATFHEDVQIDKDLNVSGKTTNEPAPTPEPVVTSTPEPTTDTTPVVPEVIRKDGDFSLEPNFAIIGDVKVNDVIRYDIGGSGESTIVINKSSKGINIYAEWGCGVQAYVDTDTLVNNELAHYAKVRLVIITDSGTTETFFPSK